MKSVTMYTDGACSGNPGPGGYETVIIYGDCSLQISKGYKNTTNNRMELMAVIDGLKSLLEPCRVSVYSDSKYIVDAINKGWLSNWINHNWIKSDDKPVLNTDLWKYLVDLMKVHLVTYNWVKGHADNEYNNLCDKLAVMACSSKNLYDDNY